MMSVDKIRDLSEYIVKEAKIYNYGNPVIGQSYFDDESPIKLVKDPGSGDDTISEFFTGVNSVVEPDGKSTSPAHKGMDMDNISELVSNSLSRDEDALKAYLARYARAMEDYKKEHGKYPKQRIIGHSRGGGGALEFMEALSKEYPKLPRVDEYIGLDPYDLPGAKDKDVHRKDKTYVAKRSIIIRPKRTGFFDSDASDMDADGKISFKERVYPGFANLLVRFARRINPFSRYKSVAVAVPGVHHSSSPEMLDVALQLSKAKTKRQAKKILEKLYDKADPALMESGESPLYGNYGEPIYEKAASEFLSRIAGKRGNNNGLQRCFG